MSSSNFRRNKAEIEKFRKDLKAMFGDIREIDKKVLNKAVNLGAAHARRNTPVVTGFMRKSWHVSPTEVKSDGAEKSLYNTADYASYVNDGHRQEVGRYVPALGKTLKKPWVEGQYMLEKANNRVEKSLIREFRKEIEEVNRKHDK